MTRRWLIDLPTRLHLWSAELQIRHRPSADPERLRQPAFWSPPALVALAVGLLTLGWAARALGWRVRV